MNTTGRGQWKKGQTGNPKGRPPAGQSLAAKFRLALHKHADAIIARHIELTEDLNATVRHAAIRTAYEGAGIIGRAQVSVEGSTEALRPVRLVIEL